MARGFAKAAQKIKRVRQQFPDRLGLAMRQETEVEATESKRRTPVDRGNLRSSVRANGPFREGRRVWCTVTAGGPSAPYALYVHEDLTAFHPVGQAKFIESVLLESRPHMAGRVAARMKFNRENYAVD